MAAIANHGLSGLLSEAERAHDEGACLRIPALFQAACRLQADPVRVKELFIQAGIPETALVYPNTW